MVRSALIGVDSLAKNFLQLLVATVERITFDAAGVVPDFGFRSRTFA